MNFILKRPLFTACAIALASAGFCTFLTGRAVWVLIGSLMFACLFVIPVKFRLKKTAILSFVFSIAVAISYGLYYSFVYAPVTEYCGRNVNAQCVAISDVSKTESGYCIDVKCVCIRHNDSERRTSFKARLYFDDKIEILPSDVLNADITFFNNTYEFSNIHIASKAENITVLKHQRTILNVVYAIRSYIINAVSGTCSDAGAFIKGMLLGDKSEISGVFRNKFTVIGMSHVMAVSGMHLMFSVMFIDLILMLIGIGYKPRSVFAVLSAALVTFISGFSVSCLRALIMITIYYVGRFLDKLHDSLTSLGFSAFIILLITPYNIGNASFILSISATFGLISVTPLLNDIITIKTGNHIVDSILYATKSVFTMSLGANIACIPAFMLIFRNVSLISPFANLILIIPLQALFYLSFLCVAAYRIPFVWKYILALIDKIYNLIEVCVDFLFNLKYTSISNENVFFYPVFCLLMILVVGLFIYNAKFNNRYAFMFIGAYFAICTTMFFVNMYLTYDSARLNFIDVGLGNSSVITKDERAVVIDCGGEYGDKIFSVLEGANTRRIQLIAITHTDYDHISYLSRLINMYEIDKIIYPELCDISNIQTALDDARANGTDIEAIYDDIEISVLDGAVIKAFVKRAYNVKPGRNVGALYKLTYHDTSAVFPGDMSIYQEYCFLDYGVDLDCDILLVPHHGSAKSLSNTILDIYSPRYSIISASKDRKYGLPDKRTLTKLEKCSEVLQTSELSTITFRIDKKGCKYIKDEYKSIK